MYTPTSSENVATLHLVIPKMKVLIMTVENVKIPNKHDDLKRFKAKLLESLNIRFQKIFEDDELQVAIFLDPTYKHLKMFIQDETKVIIARVKRLIKALPQQNTPTKSAKVRSSTSDLILVSDPFRLVVEGDDHEKDEVDSYIEYQMGKDDVTLATNNS